jgi:hypothetical protein
LISTPLVNGVQYYSAKGLQTHLQWRVRYEERGTARRAMVIRKKEYKTRKKKRADIL